MIDLGEIAPDFLMQHGEDFHEWREGRWVLLVATKALSPTCTVEFAELARLASDFADADVALAAIVCDSEDDTARWLADLSADFDITPSWPIVQDHDLSIAKRYGLLDRTGAGLQRASILIDPQGCVAALTVYPVTNGRNFSETLRIAQAAQLTLRARVATPSDWTAAGGRVMLPPSLPQAQAEELYHHGVEVLRPYLRFVDIR